MSGSGAAVVKAENQGGHAKDVRDWSLPARFAFRFVFCYFILCIYPSVLGWRDSDPSEQSNVVRKMWDHVVPWVGSNLLHSNGSFTRVPRVAADQLYDYILWLCIVITAVLAAVAWSFLDRDRKHYRTLNEWLRLLVRLTLSLVMINYGMGKVFRAQFPELSLGELLDSYGRSSPMDLLWALMKYSRAYSFVGGLGELSGAVLLLVPSLTTVGALVSLAMVSNLTMLNLFYDVPRKILCVQLLLMCFFLLLPDARRLFGFFVLHRSEQLPAPPPLFQGKAFNHAALALQLLIGMGIIFVCARASQVSAVQEAAHIKPELRGIWNVDQFNFDGLPRPPLLTDTVRWQRVILDRPEVLTIQLMDSTQKRYLVIWNPQNTNGVLWGVDHSKQGSVSVNNLQPDRMVLDGQISGHQFEAQLQRMDLSDPTKFLLTNRGFRWVQ